MHRALLNAGSELDRETLRESEESSGVGNCAPSDVVESLLDLLQSEQSQLPNQVSQDQVSQDINGCNVRSHNASGRSSGSGLFPLIVVHNPSLTNKGLSS
jgi:hypothetical protein